MSEGEAMAKVSRLSVRQQAQIIAAAKLAGETPRQYVARMAREVSVPVQFQLYRDRLQLPGKEDRR